MVYNFSFLVVYDILRCFVVVNQFIFTFELV